MLNVSKIVCSAALCVALGTVATAASNTNKGSTPNGKPFLHINGELSELSGTVASLQDQVNALAGRVDTLEEKATNLETAIEDIRLDILSLEDRMGDSEDADAELKAQIDNNVRLIAAIQEEIDAINENMVLGQYIENKICPSNMDVIGAWDGQIVCANKGSAKKRPVEQYSVYTIVRMAPGETKEVYSHCRPGDILSGGGFNQYKNVDITDSRPRSPAISPELGGVNEDKAWYVKGKNNATHNSFFYSAAQCLKFY